MFALAWALSAPPAIGRFQAERQAEQPIIRFGVEVNYVEGPVGVQYRNFSKERIHSTGWSAKVGLILGLEYAYPWIEEQVWKAQE